MRHNTHPPLLVRLQRLKVPQYLCNVVRFRGEDGEEPVSARAFIQQTRCVDEGAVDLDQVATDAAAERELGAVGALDVAHYGVVEEEQRPALPLPRHLETVRIVLIPVERETVITGVPISRSGVLKGVHIHTSG